MCATATDRSIVTYKNLQASQPAIITGIEQIVKFDSVGSDYSNKHSQQEVGVREEHK
jgi:hypothetical protein